jgi:hypothetical protein
MLGVAQNTYVVLYFFLVYEAYQNAYSHVSSHPVMEDNGMNKKSSFFTSLQPEYYLDP